MMLEDMYYDVLSYIHGYGIRYNERLMYILGNNYPNGYEVYGYNLLDREYKYITFNYGCCSYIITYINYNDDDKYRDYVIEIKGFNIDSNVYSVITYMEVDIRGNRLYKWTDKNHELSDVVVHMIRGMLPNIFF